MQDATYLPTRRELRQRMRAVRRRWNASTRAKRSCYPPLQWRPPTVSLPREVRDAMEADNER